MAKNDQRPLLLPERPWARLENLGPGPKSAFLGGVLIWILVGLVGMVVVLVRLLR